MTDRPKPANDDQPNYITDHEGYAVIVPWDGRPMPPTWGERRAEEQRRENIETARQKQQSGERMPAEAVRKADLSRVTEPSPAALELQELVKWVAARTRGEDVPRPERAPTMSAADFRKQAAQPPAESPMRFFAKKPEPESDPPRRPRPRR